MRDAEAAIAERYRLMAPQLNERQRRRFAAAEARIFGHGGGAAGAPGGGGGGKTAPQGGGGVGGGGGETGVGGGGPGLDEPEPLAPDRVRAAGAGRKPAVEGDPKL